MSPPQCARPSPALHMSPPQCARPSTDAGALRRRPPLAKAMGLCPKASPRRRAHTLTDGGGRGLLLLGDARQPALLLGRAAGGGAAAGAAVAAVGVADDDDFLSAECISCCA